MLRMIHFSDFHLNKKNIDDWNYFIKDSLLDELKTMNDESNIDLILLTGDLIDRGGKDFKSIKDALSEFHKNIILPINEALNLPIERFFIIPGNHDIDKNAENVWEDMGLKSYFDKPETVNDFIKKGKEGDYSGFKRVKPFKDFESELYSGVPDCQLSCFDSSFRFTIRDRKVGVSCLNSSWRCYDSNKDKGLILVGDTQIASSFNFIKDCEIKIALVHHPYDWISDIEQKVIKNHLNTNYDLMFVGHVHEGETIVQTDYAGSLFVNVAPGALTEIRSDSRRFSNGFTLIDYKSEEKEVKCLYKRFNHPTKKFVLNTDIGDNGEITFDIPQKKRLKQIKTAQDHLKIIIDVKYEEMNEHLISTGTDFGPKIIKDAFVLPNIIQKLIEDKKDDDSSTGISIQDIIKIESDLLFLQRKRVGKQCCCLGLFMNTLKDLSSPKLYLFI